MRKVLLASCFLMVACASMAQVNAIKNASSGNAKSGGGRSEGGSRSSGVLSYFVVDLMFNGIAQWQRQKLSRVVDNPSLLSLEIIGQAAMQPSSYYVLHPRIRGTWGLFSTDFRVNYLVEEDINGYLDLTTLDWQVLQLNLVTTRHVIGRVGLGVMAEDFGEHRTFAESTYGLQLYSNHRKLNGTIEYRTASDWSYTAPRREMSAFVENLIWEKGRAHLYGTAGGVYQRYYEAIDVWGFQAGLMMKLY